MNRVESFLGPDIKASSGMEVISSSLIDSKEKLPIESRNDSSEQAAPIYTDGEKKVSVNLPQRFDNQAFAEQIKNDTDIKFDISFDSLDVVMQLVDSDTGKVVKTVPGETAVQAVSGNVHESAGLVVDEIH